jgi:anti-repressor protein
MSELVFKTDKGTPITTSLLVAQKFEKEHKHIMRDIKEIMSKRSAQNWAHFYQSTTYVDSMNRIQEMFLMNRDGFSLLVMGFTGEKALDFKIEYIEAFNKIEEPVKEDDPTLGKVLSAINELQKIIELSKQAQLFTKDDMIEFSNYRYRIARGSYNDMIFKDWLKNRKK